MKNTLSILLISILLPTLGSARELIGKVPPPGLGLRPVPSSTLPTPVFNSPKVDGEHVRLLDGSIFKGAFKGFNENGELLWEHPGVSPIAIQPSALAKLTLKNDTVSAKSHTGVARLINGDRLTGDLKHLDDKGLVINTWYAGALTIDRHTCLLYTSPSPQDS